MGILLGKKIYQARPGLLMFECPACGDIHPVYLDNSNVVNGVVNKWSWNGDPNKPTFSPSLNVYANDDKQRCHSFVKDGMISFLDDCFHQYKNQTLEIPDWDSVF